MNLYTRTDNNPDIEVVTMEFVWKDVHVPVGFWFDGASAPRIFWGVIPPFKRTKKAACIHDWLCFNAKNKEDRAYADKCFYEALSEVKVIDKVTGKESAGINIVRRKLGYWGVRVGAMLGIGVYY